MIEYSYGQTRSSHSHGGTGHHRSKIDAKKLLALWTLLCGGVVMLLWGLFTLPKKFDVTRAIRNKTCEDELKMCLNAWNKIHATCFYLFQHKNSWPIAQENCELLSASLATFNNKIELDVLMKHVAAIRSTFWIGLNKRNLRGIWVWTNGTKYNNLHRIQDHGECAFLHQHGIDSTNCEDLRDYICTREGQCP